MSMRTDIINRKAEIMQWINENQSKAYMCKELSCKQSTLNSYLTKMNIVYAGNQGGKGIKSDPKRKCAEEYIKSSCVRSYKLKQKLIEDGIKKDECEICSTSDWMGKPLSLELHHIDGDHHNNEFINLMILCPNCHAQTDNFRGKNKNKGQ